MILYRIKRISTGRYFIGNSRETCPYTNPETNLTYYHSHFLYPWWSSQFGKTGAFYKGEDTIKRHLQNLCHDWRQTPIETPLTRNQWGQYDRYVTLGPARWERLADLEVEIITIIDHGEKTQSARDFMGILEKVE